MNGDTFINTSKYREKNTIPDEDNFFLNSSAPVHNLYDYPQEPIRHLNDYDSNILKEDAYKEVSDEVLKLEYKISKIEEELKGIDGRIQSAEDIQDYITAESLLKRKTQLEDDLRDLTKIYKEASLSARISGGFSTGIKDKIDVIKNKSNSIFGNLISKIPGKFSAVLEIKNSLNKLENINKSVDELMSRKYPYGEASERYKQLSSYIARANSIHAEISKFIKL